MAHDPWIDQYMADSTAAMAAVTANPAALGTLQAMADTVITSLLDGGKLLLAGNGGSAADAQHIAAEFVGRLFHDRDALPAIALTTDSSILTAVANDYGFDHVFERQVRALGRPGDVLLGISTSGRSANVLRALDAARAEGLTCMAFSGADPGPMAERAELVFAAPSRLNAIIQQVHITAGHVLCGLVERALFPDTVR